MTCILEGNEVLAHAFGVCRGHIVSARARGNALDAIVELCQWHASLAKQGASRNATFPISREEAEDVAWRIALKTQNRLALKGEAGYA